MRRPHLGRLVALLVVMVLSLAGIFGRLTVLQVSRAEQFRDLAYAQRVDRSELPARRGEIMDRNGEMLAVSLEARDVYAMGDDVVEPRGTAIAIAEVLDARVRDLLPALEGTGFAFVARQVDLPLAERIEALELAGIGTLPVSKRYYPAGKLAGHVLGVVGIDGAGLEGLEAQYDELLAGRPGELVEEVDTQGRPIPHGYSWTEPPVDGSDLILTIDSELQFAVQRALREHVELNLAKGGTVIVLDPATGEILAMATYPSFDPNAFAEVDEDERRNRAVTDAVEPGSVNKVITAAAAVQERAVPLGRVFSVADRIRVADAVIHDSHPHPVQQMTIGDIIAQSSNVGIVKVADELGQNALSAYLARFGFGRETGLGFPGEASGLLPPVSEWSATSLPTMAFGQGVSVSPLQMAAVYATIANGGVWVQPRLVKAVVAPDEGTSATPPSPTRRVVSRETAQIVIRMLAYAVDEGTGQQARVGGYQVAGKTGTARKPYTDRSGYSNRYVASFIGFLPASEPRVVIAAMLDEPVTVWGGLAAAPLFREVARTTIQRMQIEPGVPVPPPPTAREQR